MSGTLETTSTSTKKPHRSWYLVAVSLFFLGPLLGFCLILNILHVQKYIIKFSVPGVSSIVIQKPGSYTVWGTVPKTQTDSKLLPETLEKIDIFFKHLQTREVIDFSPKVGWKETEHDSVHVSLGNVYFKHSGRYEIISQGPALNIFQLYLRKPSFGEIVKTLSLGFLSTMLGVISGILFGLIIFVKRLNAGMNGEKAPKPEPKTVYDRNETMWAMFCHLSGFLGFIFPFGNIIAPLIIWAFKKQDSAFIDDQGKEAINFQISILIYYLIALILILVVIGVFLLPLIAAFHIIAMIIASVESASGKVFRYPFCIRFLKPTL